MVYHIQNYWVFGLYPSSGILGTRKRERGTMGKVQKPSNSECDTPLSEPFKIYSLPSITHFRKFRLQHQCTLQLV
jgi:hypothetical protein